MTALVLLAAAPPTSAQERLCDNSFEDCRATIIQMIRAENVGLDVSMWFMTDTRYSTEIIQRWRAGVAVRILLDLRADANYPANASRAPEFHQRRDPDPPQNHAWHQSLEGDPLRRPGPGAFQRGELRERILLAGHAVHGATWTKRSISLATQTSCTRS